MHYLLQVFSITGLWKINLDLQTNFTSMSLEQGQLKSLKQDEWNRANNKIFIKGKIRSNFKHTNLHFSLVVCNMKPNTFQNISVFYEWSLKIRVKFNLKHIFKNAGPSRVQLRVEQIQKQDENIILTPNENYFEWNKAKSLALPSFFSISKTKLDATVNNLRW